MTVNQASSQQLLFPLDLFFSASRNGAYQDLKLSLGILVLFFEETSIDHVVISGFR
jgi:DNA mismatch repair protein MutL